MSGPATVTGAAGPAGTPTATAPALSPVVSAIVAAGSGVLSALPQLVQIFRDLGGAADAPVAARLQEILGQVSEVDRAAAAGEALARELVAARGAAQPLRSPTAAPGSSPPVASTADSSG